MSQVPVLTGSSPVLGGLPDSPTPTRLLLALARIDCLAVLWGTLTAVLALVAQALLPLTIGWTVDSVLSRDTVALHMHAGLILGCGVVHALANVLSDRCAVAASLAAVYGTIGLLNRQTCRLGRQLVHRTTTSDVVSLAVGDIPHLGAAMSVIGRGTAGVAASATATAILWSITWYIGLMALIWTAAAASLLITLIKSLHGRQQSLRSCQGELAAHAIDTLGGLRILRGIGGEQGFAQRYRASSQRARRAGLHVSRVEACFAASEVLLPGLLLVGAGSLGAHQVAAGRMSIGELVATFGYIAFLAIPLRAVIDAADKVAKGHVAARRLASFLSLNTATRPGRPLTGASERSEVLEEPASGLRLKPGQFTAVVCADPADATTLADRLGGFVPSEVRYGGAPLRESLPREMRHLLLVVDDGSHMFAGPLRRELDPVGRAEHDEHLLLAAIETADAGDIIDGLPHGLDTEIVTPAYEFSGGQLQRLRLARALMVDPAVLILREPTSAVDAHTEARIADRLRDCRPDRSTVVFCTSPLTLGRAVHVVFVVDGHVVAEGTHDQLLTDQCYRDLVARGGGGP
ncbi:ABC transporter transmembrane domain-containing protein [Streptomyces sp. NPDC056437]|uniref:ABC transporter transmembrane domain-containing protein n=1 Tax=Streptomyces sp. NPDC056437 TaxID=3345816 RepID=UPI00367BA8FC